MKSFKSAFIQLALQHNVLQFGQFKLKSGRISPYFFNAGAFYHGNALQQLGVFYAQSIIDHQLDFNHLFGPAYKGLPLATATAIGLATLGVNTTVTFDRKETKDHGEKGVLIGAPLTGNTLIIDDVISAGTAFRSSQQLIEAHGGTVTGVIIALDRCERGLGSDSAIQEIENQGIRVISLITVFDLISHLQEHPDNPWVQLIENYLEQYGC